jgi:hypothetical protein
MESAARVLYVSADVATTRPVAVTVRRHVQLAPLLARWNRMAVAAATGAKAGPSVAPIWPAESAPTWTPA